MSGPIEANAGHKTFTYVICILCLALMAVPKKGVDWSHRLKVVSKEVGRLDRAVRNKPNQLSREH